MTYTEAVQFLYDLRLFGMRLGLETVQRLAALEGNPQASLRFIHVAGTNGKGSTCAMLESIYRAARDGESVCTRRRIWFRSPSASRSIAAQSATGMQPVLTEELRARLQSPEMEGAWPTFFEAVTIMALKYFAGRGCDLVIWETGLGGRLDATNIVAPLASVITNVQFDHQQHLGDTIAKIAREKAGIIKPGVPILTTATDAAALEVIIQAAAEQQAPLTVITDADRELGDLEVGLAGAHQRTNAALAVATARKLRGQVPVTEEQIRAGLKEVRWAGRLQIARRENGQTILLDGAHNPAGARTLADALPQLLPPDGPSEGGKPVLILGCMRDKDYAGICSILAPLASRIILTPTGSDRSAEPLALARHCREANPQAALGACASMADALERTATASQVIVAGSLHFVGEAMEILRLAPGKSERGLNDYHPSAKTAEPAAGPAQKRPPFAPSTILAVTLDVGGTPDRTVALRGACLCAGGVGSRRASGPGSSQSPLCRRVEGQEEFRPHARRLGAVGGSGLRGSGQIAAEREFFPALYDAFAAPAAWRIRPDVMACLEELRRRGLRIGAISNWDERVVERLPPAEV